MPDLIKRWSFLKSLGLGRLIAALALGCALLPGAAAPGQTPKPLTRVTELHPDIDAKTGKTCISADCHPSPVASGVLEHPPFREGHCLACHEDHTTSAGHRLRPLTNAMCLACHTGMAVTTGALSLIHPPGGQRCLDCHNPHQSRQRNLLRDKGQLLICAQCHADFLKESAKLPYRHHYLDPTTECGSCHYAHRRSAAHYVRENVSETCLTCHDLPIRVGERVLDNVAEQINRAPVVHGALTQGSCAACHTPHGSRQPSLLKAGYPAGGYEVYETGQYALCWQCHPKALAENPRDESVTAFRNGPENLHWLHVARLKHGRACHLCHAAHASDAPHLLRETVTFGQWRAPLIYKQKADGGSCQTPCHRERTYSRREAVKPAGSGESVK